MSANDNDITSLSRRKLLGGAATIGAAGALGGMGTMAFFSDEEEFANNQLTAGELDLKVDWEEHYSDWSDDEASGLQHTVRMDPPPQGEEDMWVGLPDPDSPMIWVHVDDLGTFMDNTSLEAYPDDNDDGVQDDVGITFGEDGGETQQFDACANFADLPEDLDPTGGKELRTLNDDTVANLQEVVEEGADADYLPLVNLHDVKPGDFGELTLSFHLCDNPGYIWLQGELVDESENGHTEPEAKDPDEEDGVVELTDEIQTLLWYDEDGDNVYEPSGTAGKVDVMLVLDDSGSMSGSKITAAKSAAKDLVDALTLDSTNAGQIGLVRFDNTVSMPQGLTDDGSAVKSAIDGLSAGGTTNIEGAVEGAHEELTGSDISDDVAASGADRDDAQKIMVLLSDGAPNVDDDGDGSVDPVDEATAAKNDGIEMFTIGFGISSGSSTAQTLEDMASDPKESHAFIGDEDEIEQIFANISQIIEGEECFWRGSLRDLLDVLSQDNGIPLDGNRQTPFNEVPGVGQDEQAPSDPTSDARDCFVDSTTNAIGLAWWLPVDHANEIQGDSVSFNLGFYTEQCRHNDGSGISAGNA